MLPNQAPTQRPLYEESRARMCERVTGNIQSIGSICRQVLKGSRSGDIMANSAKQFSLVDANIVSTETNIKRLQSVVGNFDAQLRSIDRTVEKYSNYEHLAE